MSHSPDSDKRYQSKCKRYYVKLSLKYLGLGNAMEKYLEDNNISFNSYVTGLIKKDLFEKNVYKHDNCNDCNE